MRRLVVVIVACMVGAGCNADPPPDDAKDTMAVLEAVFRDELKAAKGAAGYYLFVDGKDPAPELLARLKEDFHHVQAGSKVPPGNAIRINVGELKFIDRNTAEVRGSSSNGMDGRGSRYRVIRNRRNPGEWIVDNIVVEVES